MRPLLLAIVGLLVLGLGCAGLPTPALDVAAPGAAVPLAAAPGLEGHVAVSPDLAHALAATSSGDGWSITLDDRVIAGPVDAVQTLGFLPDGTPHASFRRGNAVYQIVGERRMGPYEAIGKGGVTGGGGHTSFQAKRRGRWHTVVDGDEGASWEQTSPALLADDGRAAWLGVQDGRTVVIVEGREIATADEAFLKASGHGRLAWAGRDGRTWRLFLDDEAVPGTWARVGNVALGPERWAYTAKDARGWWVVASDGLRAGPFPNTGPVSYAADGRLVWYEGGDRGWRVHVGDWVGPVVPEIGASAPVLAGERILWWAQGEVDTIRDRDRVVGKVATMSEIAPWFAGGEPAWVGHDGEGWRVFVGDWQTGPSVAIARAVTHEGYLATVRQDADGWGVSLYHIGEDAPLGRWTGDVYTDRGGGVRFVDGALWFTMREGDRIVRREVPLPSASAQRRDPPTDPEPSPRRKRRL